MDEAVTPPRSPPRTSRGRHPRRRWHCASYAVALSAVLAAGATVAFALFRADPSPSRVLHAALRASEDRNAYPVARPAESEDDNFASIFPETAARKAPSAAGADGPLLPKVLILTPVKNSAHHLTRFFKNVRSLSYPRDRLSLGILESDSDDVVSEPVWAQLEAAAVTSPVLGAILAKHRRRGSSTPPPTGAKAGATPTATTTHAPPIASAAGSAAALNATSGSGNATALRGHDHGRGLVAGARLTGTLALLLAELPALKAELGRVAVFQHDFGLSLSRAERHSQGKQLVRRGVLARSRNHLLLSALRDEDFVLWVDSDLQSYPPDVIQLLVGAGKQIVTPHCVMEPGGRSYDLNSWRVRNETLGNNASLDAVRAYHDRIAMRAVKSGNARDLRVEGYDNSHDHVYLQHLRKQGPVVRLDAVGGAMLLVSAELHRQGLVFPPFTYGFTGRIETEGLSMMALDMGVLSWGMPGVEVFHK